MSASTPLFYWQEKLGKTQPRIAIFAYDITAAKTVSPRVFGYPVTTTFDAIAAQATIDDTLGTTNEFLISAFDATAMGNDTFGGVVGMANQASSLLWMEAKCYSGTGGSTMVERTVKASSSLTASTLATECAVGAYGNLAFKVDFGNTPDFDALTSGLIVVRLAWLSK